MLLLTHAEDLLTVAPAQGGAILSWPRGGRDVLRAPSPGAAACFPMVPYCNRIAHRRFGTHLLAPNFGDHPHAIHGVGWKAAWTVEAETIDAATLSLFSNEDWPFAFAARLTYRLDAAGLTIELAAENRHAAAAPMGIGMHPYFARDARTALTFQADGVWHNDATALPVSHGPVPSEWSHAAGRAVDDAPLDNCFTGWAGAAATARIRIEADPVFGCLQVYTPAGAGFFCVEPVSHAPDAINRTLPPGQAMTILPSGLPAGGTLRGTMRFSPL